MPGPDRRCRHLQLLLTSRGVPAEMARSSSESGEERARRHRDRHRSSRHKSKRSQRSRSSSRSRHRRRRSRERSPDRRRRHRSRSRSDSRRRRRRSSSSPSSERGGSARHSKQASPSPPPQAAAVSLQADDPASRAHAIAAIEEDGFVQHAFLSGKGRITAGWGEKGLSTDEKETLANMATAGAEGGEEEAICHPKLSQGVQEKTDQWVKKILTIRQKLLAAGSGLG